MTTSETGDALGARVKATQRTNPKLSYEECFTACMHDKSLGLTVTMADEVAAAASVCALTPGYNTSALPTPMKAEMLKQYQAIDNVLIAASVTAAMQKAIDDRVTVLPKVTSAYQNAINYIQKHPGMDRAEAMAMATEGARLDQETLIARNVAASLPPVSMDREKVRG